MITPVDILSLNFEELSRAMAGMGEKAFRASQVRQWIFERHAGSFEDMTNLPEPLRKRLASDLPFPILKEKDRRVSADGTTKFLFELFDGQKIETVFIPTEKRNTLCISSQAGCKFGCGFCASGLGGWKRDLTTGEIIGQILWAFRMMAPKPVTHVVFMGVGEPFDNYDNVLKAARIINSKDGFNIAARRITISTCGLIPGIQRFAAEGLQIELSVSLHAPNDAIRARLMPVNRKYPFAKLMAACRDYARTTNRQVTFEYILIKGLTCTEAAAEELARHLSGWLSKVNLIPCNPVKEFNYEAPPKKEIFAFKNALERRGIVCTLRSERGQEVAAACGQLRIGSSH